MLNSINWSEKYRPGTTDNFASNEVIVKGLTVDDVWPYLVHIQEWGKYYQLGTPAAAMAGTNTMIDGHQAWLNGLVKYAFANRKYTAWIGKEYRIGVLGFNILFDN